MIKEFGFGSGDEGLDSKGRRFKAKDGETYRMSFVWWDGIDKGAPVLDAANPDDAPPSPKFIGCKRLYLPGVGYFIDHGPEYAALAGGPGKMYAATMIVCWPLDSKGGVDRARFAAGDFKLHSWVISEEKYRAIGTTHREFPLGLHDLTATCPEGGAQFQKLTFSPCRESLFRKLVEAKKADAVLAAVRALALEMRDELAQDLTLEQIREKLGRAQGGSPGLPSMGGGAGGVSSKSAPAMTASDFDNLLGDIVAPK